MSLRTDLLADIEQIRIDVRQGLDQCPNRLTILRRDWSGGRVGLGTAVETILIDFPPYLPIRYMSAHEVLSSGDWYTTQDVMVSRITPSNGGAHGFTPEQLQPKLTTNGIELVYRVSGQIVGDYEIIDNRIGGRASHPGGYSGRGGTYSFALILRRRRDSL